MPRAGLDPPSGATTAAAAVVGAVGLAAGTTVMSGDGPLFSKVSSPL